MFIPGLFLQVPPHSLPELKVQHSKPSTVDKPSASAATAAQSYIETAS